MAWIRMEEDGEAPEELMAASVDPLTGRVDEILKVHSLHPQGWRAHLSLYGAVMRGTPGLRKLEREMIALVVSGVNACHY